MTEQKEMIEFDKCAARVIEIQEAGNFLPDTTTKAGYEASKRFVLDHTTPARTDLAKAHTAAKAFWISGSKSVDKRKNEILDLLVEIQEPHQKAYKAFDQIEKDKKLKFESDLNDKINVFSNFCHSAAGLNSEQITTLIQECGEIDTQEGFYHKGAEAAKARIEALTFLNEALMLAVNQEAEYQRQQQLAEENRARQAQIDEQQESMRLQQEEMNRKQAEIDEAANKASAKVQAEENERQRVIDEQAMIEQEKKAKIYREEYAAQQAEIAAEQAKKQEQARQKKLIDDQKAADEKRASNTRHVTKIKTQAKKSFIALGFSEDDAIKAVQALSHGEIKNCTINY